MKHRCPVCHEIVKALSKEKSEEAKFFPFCSRRCKFIDLGAWLDAEYKIVSESRPQEPDESSDNTPISPDRQ